MGGGQGSHGHEGLHMHLRELGPQGTQAHGTARGSVQTQEEASQEREKPSGHKGAGGGSGGCRAWT